jgi:hypothetical protein
LLFLSLLIFSIVLFKNKKLLFAKFYQYKLVILITLIGCIFWFFTAPDPRFGYGFLFSFPILILSISAMIFNLEFIYNKISSLENYKNLFIKIISLLFLILFILGLMLVTKLLNNFFINCLMILKKGSLDSGYWQYIIPEYGFLFLILSFVFFMLVFLNKINKIRFIHLIFFLSFLTAAIMNKYIKLNEILDTNKIYVSPIIEEKTYENNIVYIQLVDRKYWDCPLPAAFNNVNKNIKFIFDKNHKIKVIYFDK